MENATPSEIQDDMESKTIHSGLTFLDEVIQGLRLGDNVVWQVDHLEDYVRFAEPFATQAIRDGYRCVYMRFAPHEPILGPRNGLEVIETDPSPGLIFSVVRRIE